MFIKRMLTAITAILLPWFSPTASANDDISLTKYVMADGSLLHGMSDNGRWAVAYGVDPASSAYNYAKIVDLATQQVTPIVPEDGTEIYGCLANDVTDDGKIVVGSLQGRPAWWSAESGKWVMLPTTGGKRGGHATAVTPDGRYAVGLCTDGGLEETPALWDLQGQKAIATPNLPPCNLAGSNEGMVRFTGISADGRYITACMDFSFPQYVLCFVYDTESHTWDPVAFDFDEATHRFTAKDDDVATLDGLCISPNGQWVAGTVCNTSDVSHPFRYNLTTKEFENYKGSDDLDKGCVCIDNEGTVYAATPALNPVRTLHIRANGYWYALDEILSQGYGMNYYNETGFNVTGFPIAISADCRTLAANAYISQDNYTLTLPEKFADVCNNVNLLRSFTASIPSGASIAKMASVELRFTRRVTVKGNTADVVLRDENGTVVKTAIGFKGNATDAKVVNVGFRTFTLEKGKRYTLEIPAGTIALEGDEAKTNENIVLEYVGLGTEPFETVGISPADGSTLGHIDMTTTPVIFTFPCHVKVADGATASLYSGDGGEPVATLQLLAGITESTCRQVMAYPTASINLYKGSAYRVVLPAGAVTDMSGYAANSAAEVAYEGSYELTIVSDNSHIYKENFASGMGNVMIYDGDGRTPTDEMKKWGFNATERPWWYVADDDYTNTAAASHSMYSPSGKSNDWMMTPQLSIPDDKCRLTFKAQSYRRGKDDRLKVILWASDEPCNVLTADIVQRVAEEGKTIVDAVLSPGQKEAVLAGDWQDFDVDLAEYAGKKVYFAFLNENDNQSAVFVTDIMVLHQTDFQIALSNVAETVVAQEEMKVEGSIIVKNAEKTYNSLTLTLNDAEGQALATIADGGLALKEGDEYAFRFDNPIALTIGRDNRFTLNATLHADGGQSDDYLHISVKNLAYRPTKRAVLEENTGMACPNCPLGHLAIEKLQSVYGERFIPIAYHTYTGDPYESGMTDYVQYFLGLNAAPTGVVSRSEGGAPMVSTVNGGTVDYSFTSDEGNCWMDIVERLFKTDAIAEIALNADYDAETQNVTAQYSVNYAIDVEKNNVGLLFIVTENGLKGYQSNNLYNQTDPDLGPWGKDGEYGISTISPFTFDHVARDLYPANNYFGLSGLIPTTIEHGVDYAGSVTMNAKTDLRHVKDIANCAVTAMLIDLNTGAMVNAAHAPIAVETAVKPTVADGNEPKVGVSGGNLRVKAQGTFSVSIAGVDGRCVGTARAHGEVELPLPAQGAYIVTVTTDHGQFTEKVLHAGK